MINQEKASGYKDKSLHDWPKDQVLFEIGVLTYWIDKYYKLVRIHITLRKETCIYRNSGCVRFFLV
jgi:hypothetical protein